MIRAVPYNINSMTQWYNRSMTENQSVAENMNRPLNFLPFQVLRVCTFACIFSFAFLTYYDTVAQSGDKFSEINATNILFARTHNVDLSWLIHWKCRPQFWLIIFDKNQLSGQKMVAVKCWRKRNQIFAHTLGWIRLSRSFACIHPADYLWLCQKNSGRKCLKSTVVTLKWETKVA